MVIVRDRFDEFSIKRGAVTVQVGRPSEVKSSKSGFLADFFAEVTKIQADFIEAGKMVEIMEKARIDSHHAVTIEDEKGATHKLEQALSNANKHLQLVKARVDRLNEQTTTAKDMDPPIMEPQEIKIRQNMVAALVRKFAVHVKNLNNQEDLFKQEARNRAIRQLQIAMPQTTQEEVVEMVDQGQDTEQIMRQKMIGVHSSVADALHRVQDKHKDVRKLEKSMNEMHQMFQDMAKLVSHQTEFIDHISYSVEKANTRVQAGEKELKKADQARRKARKYQCCATVCITICLAGFVAAIAI